jgi:tetratricopeptide (TPR) repeat protein
LAEQPKDVLAGYLVARVETAAVALNMLRSLHERAPTDRYVLRAFAHALATSGDHAGAIAAWRELEQVDRPAYNEAIPLIGQALAALGRTREALRALEQKVQGESSTRAFERALMYARVARLAHEDQEALAYKLQLNDPALIARLRARLGQELLEADLAGLHEDVRAVIKLELLARLAPNTALMLVPTLPAKVLQSVSQDVWFLLYAEAVRVSALASEPALAALREHCPAGPVWPKAVELFVLTGVDSSELEDLPLQVRALLYFVRSRTGTLPAAERALWLQKARSVDVLHDVVNEVSLAWAG